MHDLLSALAEKLPDMISPRKSWFARGVSFRSVSFGDCSIFDGHPHLSSLFFDSRSCAQLRGLRYLPLDGSAYVREVGIRCCGGIAAKDESATAVLTSLDSDCVASWVSSVKLVVLNCHPMLNSVRWWKMDAI